MLKSFRNIPKVDVLPVGSAGVADVIGHASLSSPQAALDDARGAASATSSGTPKPEEEAS